VTSPAAKAAAVVAATALAVVLFLVLGDASEEEGEQPARVETATQGRDGGSDGGTTQEPDRAPKPEGPKVPVIEIQGGEPVGGVAELEFEQGEEIRFVVRSDVADHVHLHGYDVFEDVEAGGEARFSVPATIEGVFEAELEDRGVPIAEITVNP